MIHLSPQKNEDKKSECNLHELKHRGKFKLLLRFKDHATTFQRVETNLHTFLT
jgi:hypothetical protein